MMEKISLKNIRSFFLIFVLSIWASVSFAGLGDGWGLLFDLGQLKVINENTGTEYQESKVIGDQIDYQFALGKSFSIILFAT